MKKVPFGTIINIVRQKIYNLKALPQFVKHHKILVASVVGLVVVGSGIFLLWPKHPAQPPAQSPQLVVSQPKYVNNHTMIISGQTDSGASVTVDGLAVQVQSDGSFKVTLDGNIVSRIMRVVATNSAGLEKVDELDIIPPDVSARDSLPKIPQTASQDASTSNAQTYSPPPAQATSTPQGRSYPQDQTVTGPIKPVAPTPITPGGDYTKVPVNKNAPKPYLTLSVPAKTNNPKVVVTGLGVPGATVYVNYQVTVTVGKDSHYSATINLPHWGLNQISVTETYPGWGYYEPLQQAEVTYVAPPQVTVKAYGQFNNLSPVPASTSASYLELNIAFQDVDLNNGVTVIIGTEKPVKSSTGSMNYKWNLNSGANTLKVTITDDMGNSTVQNLTVKH